MKKIDIVNIIHGNKNFTGSVASAEKLTEDIFMEIASGMVLKEKSYISGFGVFKKKLRKGGIRRNPKTGEKVKTTDRYVAKFVPAKKLTAFLNDN